MVTTTTTRTVQAKAGPMTLLGNEIKAGDPAPTNVPMVRTDMSPTNLAEHRGTPRLYSVTPSLDTSLCNKQTVTFNEKLGALDGSYKAFAVSVDLPPAQHRFAEEFKVDRITPLSDYKDVAFGENFGVLMQENRFLARSVFVVDGNDRVTYVQVMESLGDEPDYDKAIAALREAMKR